MVLIQCRLGSICSRSSSRNRVGFVVLVNLRSNGSRGACLVPPSLDKCTNVSFHGRAEWISVVVRYLLVRRWLADLGKLLVSRVYLWRLRLASGVIMVLDFRFGYVG